jgi:hypothetical protein
VSFRFAKRIEFIVGHYRSSVLVISDSTIAFFSTLSTRSYEFVKSDRLYVKVAEHLKKLTKSFILLLRKHPRIQQYPQSSIGYGINPMKQHIGNAANHLKNQLQHL